MDADNIKITGITVHGFHGLYDEERQNGQVFIIDLVMYTSSIALAGQEDSLSKAIDYSKVVEKVAAIATGKPVNLIETLAEHIAQMILQSFKKVETVEVTVHKPNAPLSVKTQDVSVSIERSR